MRYRLIIFDWDGTLADSVAGIVASMQAAIAAVGLPPRSDRQIADLIGLGFDDGLSRLYPQLAPQVTRALIDAYRRSAPAQAYRAPLFPDALPTLRRLHRRGYRLAVATGKSRGGLDQALAAQLEVARLLHASRAADETADKPDPRMLRELLAETETDSSQALMVGDTEYDMAMAATIGVPALGVVGGAHDAGRLRKAGARVVLARLSALPAWLERAE